MAVSLLDSSGRVFWSSEWPPAFPHAVACIKPVWQLACGEHAERLKQAVSVASMACEPQSGYFSLVSPVDGQSYAFEATYHAARETAVVCTWKPAVAVAVLTPVEITILRLSLDDQDSKQIAVAMDSSESTVNYHWAAIRKKLGTETNMGAAGEAIRLGLIVP